MPSHGDKELLEIDGREVAISNPGKVLFPQAGYTKLDLVRYYLAVAGRRAARRGRPAERPRALSERHRRRVLLPEARAAVAAGLDRGRVARVSVGPRRRRSRAARRGGARLDGQPRLPRAASAPGARRRSRSSRRAARRSRSGARRRPGSSCARSRASSARRWRISGSSAGRRRRARAACTSTCASSGAGRSTEVRRAALALAREVERRAPELATSKWWKEERHGVFLDYNQNAKDRTVAARVLRAADARRARLGAADVGRDRRLRPGRLHARDDAGALRARSAIGMRTSIGIRARSRACSSSSARHEREGLGDAPWPPHYRKQPGEPPRVQPSRRRVPKHPLIEIGRAREEGRRAGGARALEGAPSRGGGAPRAGRRARRCDARPVSHVDAHSREPAARAAELRPAQEALDPDEAPDDWSGVSPEGDPRRRPSRARKAS